MDSNQELIPVDTDDLQKRHRQEKKDLQAKIQSLKKSIPKGDKKKKKEVTEEIAILEKDLEDRHAKQLEDVKAAEPDLIENDSIETELNDDNLSEIITEKVPVKASRAQKRREKKEHEAREREKRISEQAERNKEGPRVVEMNSIIKVLKDLNLQIHNIPADGNCLYLAVNHQLQVTGKATFTVNELRKKTANFMRDHKDDFIPFMYSEDDDGDIISEEAFESYCKEVEKTKLWGGQLELKALSNILQSPIKIIQAVGPPTIQGESFKGPELILTYHRRLYRLGEHYNSTLPAEEESV